MNYQLNGEKDMLSTKLSAHRTLICLVALVTLSLSGCSAAKYAGAKDASEVDLSLLNVNTRSSELVQAFGAASESIEITNFQPIVRRDTFSVDKGVSGKGTKAFLSGAAAVYTLGISELFTNDSAEEAANNRTMYRVYVDQSDKVYGIARQVKDTKNSNYWFPESKTGMWKNGIPCDEFLPERLDMYWRALILLKKDELAEQVKKCATPASSDSVQVSS
jgi:hypothetical protein